jgi:hypothetical protein
MNEFTNEMPLYDEVVATIMSNIIVERFRCGKIVLWDFQEDNDWDRLYFNVAAIVADMNHEAIYLQMPYHKYLKMKWRRRKQRKNLRYLYSWRAYNVPPENKTSVYIIMDFVREYHKLPESYFKEINDKYYGWC